MEGACIASGQTPGCSLEAGGVLIAIHASSVVMSAGNAMQVNGVVAARIGLGILGRLPGSDCKTVWT